MFTNILNADRMQSMRERQFAQEMLNADRNFQFQKDQQEYNFQAGNRDYDLRREYQQAQLRNFDLNAQQAQWQLQLQKENYNNAQEAIGMAPVWRDELNRRLGPSGAYGPKADEIMADFVLDKGTNPAYKAVLDQLLIDYKARAQTYKENVFNQTITKATSLLGTGELGSLKFSDPNLPSDVGEVSGNFILSQLKQARAQGDIDNMMLYQGMLNSGIEDLNRKKQQRMQEQSMVRAAGLGLPLEQVDVKGGEMSARFGYPKTIKGAGSKGTATEKMLEKTNVEALTGLETSMRDAKTELEAADTALQAIDKSSAEYALREKERNDLAKDYALKQSLYEEAASRIAGQPDITTGERPTPGEQPKTQVPAPTATPTGAPSPLDILKGAEKKAETEPTAAQVPDLTAPLLNPTAQRFEQIANIGGAIVSPVKAVANVAKSLTGVEAGLTSEKPISVQQFVKQNTEALGQLAAVRELRKKATLAAKARVSKGENPTKAYNEELQRLVAEYQATNKPTISIR